ncbi:MAG TPA: hypothetical protein VIM53_04595 [Candidatus Saccharimonadales bacterium]
MSNRSTDELTSEARIFSKYLLHKVPSENAVQLYAKAMQANPGKVEDEAKLLQFALKHAWLLGCIDGGLVLVQPHSEVRRRIYTMLSILETTPDFAEDFLPKQRKWPYIFVVGWAGLRGAARAVVGVFIVKAVS